MVGGDKNPPTHDNTRAANVVRGREWRNFVHHTEPKEIDKATFDRKWDEGTKIIQDLNYTECDTVKLKAMPLDPEYGVVLKALSTFVNQLRTQMQMKQDKLENDQIKFEDKQNHLEDIQNHLEDKQNDVEDQQKKLEDKQNHLEEKHKNLEQSKDSNVRQIIEMRNTIQSLEKQLEDIATECEYLKKSPISNFSTGKG